MCFREQEVKEWGEKELTFRANTAHRLLDRNSCDTRRTSALGDRIRVLEKDGKF